MEPGMSRPNDLWVNCAVDRGVSPVLDVDYNLAPLLSPLPTMRVRTLAQQEMF